METPICREIPDSTFCVSLNRADISLCPTCDPSELTQPLKICKDLVLLPGGECLFGAIWHHFGNGSWQRHPEFFQSSMKSFKIGFLHFFHDPPLGSKLVSGGGVCFQGGLGSVLGDIWHIKVVFTFGMGLGKECFVGCPVAFLPTKPFFLQRLHQGLF